MGSYRREARLTFWRLRVWLSPSGFTYGRNRLRCSPVTATSAEGHSYTLIPAFRLPLRKKRLLLHLIQLVHQGLERRARVVER